MFLKIAILVLSILKTARCSLVIDGLSQNAVYMADYCPKMEYCVEGSHVMCMFYSPHNTMGPQCINPQNVSITAEIASKLLDVVNAIRSKIALGKEKGKNGRYLPRAYGMFRLKWDSELATFAQVLTNQCVLRRDNCRASKWFPDPEQVAGQVRFTISDWSPVSGAGHNMSLGLTAAKIMYAVMQTLKSWYQFKSFVTEDMVVKYPDWRQNPTKQNGRPYLALIYAYATHMGCGISAYTSYKYNDNKADLTFNLIHIVCNISGRPRKGTRSFPTSPPPGSGDTVNCGCPIGTKEDSDCLCTAIDLKDRFPGSSKSIARSCNGLADDCEPTLVLLPIFTVEDAPPQKLISTAAGIETPLKSYLRERFDNSSRRNPESQEIFNIFANTANDHSISNVLRTALTIPESPGILPRQSPKQNYVLNRYFDGKSSRPAQQMKLHEYPRHPKKFADNKKTSIFTRVAKFQLPTRKYNGLTDNIVIKKDVPPRKDFSNVQQLVNTYSKKLRIEHDGFRKGLTKKNDKISKGIINYEDDFSTETSLNKVEEKVMSYNQYLKQKLNYSDHHRSANNKVNEENENKLMTLLDTLEHEVKHIELNGNEKEIFDAKLRKIYGTVVGKPVELLTQKQNKLINKDQHTDIELENELMELNHFSDYEKAQHGTTRLANDIRRYDNNHITEDERKVDTHYNDKRPNSVKVNYEEMHKRARPTKNQNEEYITKDIFRDHNNKLSSDEVVKPGNYDKYSDLERGYKSMDSLKRRSQDDGVIKSKTYYSHKNDDHNDDDPLSMERRKYYQDKLENLERRMHEARVPKHKNDHGPERQIRRMRPERDEMQVRPSRSKSQIDAFYMPDRARYLHGFR